MGMNVGLNEYTLGVITINKEVKNAGCPVFYVKDDKELQQKALLMSKSVGGMVHQIDKETLIIVKH
ncbi:MAG: hypothetical protein R3Y64_09145 [Peptostreptococcaceae bacterium]